MTHWPFRTVYAHIIHQKPIGDNPNPVVSQSSPERKHDLRGSVPPRRHVLRHIDLALRRRIETPAETEIAYLQLTIRINQQVSWLEISVND